MWCTKYFLGCPHWIWICIAKRYLSQINTPTHQRLGLGSQRSLGMAFFQTAELRNRWFALLAIGNTCRQEWRRGTIVRGWEPLEQSGTFKIGCWNVQSGDAIRNFFKHPCSMLAYAKTLRETRTIQLRGFSLPELTFQDSFQATLPCSLHPKASIQGCVIFSATNPIVDRMRASNNRSCHNSIVVPSRPNWNQ